MSRSPHIEIQRGAKGLRRDSSGLYVLLINFLPNQRNIFFFQGKKVGEEHPKKTCQVGND